MIFINKQHVILCKLISTHSCKLEDPQRSLCPVLWHICQRQEQLSWANVNSTVQSNAIIQFSDLRMHGRQVYLWLLVCGHWSPEPPRRSRLRATCSHWTRQRSKNNKTINPSIWYIDPLLFDNQSHDWTKKKEKDFQSIIWSLHLENVIIKSHAINLIL